MQFLIKSRWVMLFCVFVTSCVLSGCVTSGEKKTSAKSDTVKEDKNPQSDTKGKSSPTDSAKSEERSYSLSERACLERAIFFEANRSSREGLIAVGTVVMNRVNSSHYPNTICGVVGQKNQFAPGVLTRKINIKELPDVREAADAVLRGERHPKLKNAMFFHVAGLKFPYTNMHYTLVAGGNAFYEKRKRDGTLHIAVNDMPYDVTHAFAQEEKNNAPKEVLTQIPALPSGMIDQVTTAAIIPASRPVRDVSQQQETPKQIHNLIEDPSPPTLSAGSDVALALP